MRGEDVKAQEVGGGTRTLDTYVKTNISLAMALGAVARSPCPPWGSVGSGGFWGCRIHFRGCFCAVLGFLGSEPLLELGSRVLRVPGVPLSPPWCLARVAPVAHVFVFWLSGCLWARLLVGCVLRVLQGILLGTGSGNTEGGWLPRDLRAIGKPCRVR